MFSYYTLFWILEHQPVWWVIEYLKYLKKLLSTITYFHKMGWFILITPVYSFHSQDLICNSPCCLPYNSMILAFGVPSTNVPLIDSFLLTDICLTFDDFHSFMSSFPSLPFQRLSLSSQRLSVSSLKMPKWIHCFVCCVMWVWCDGVNLYCYM